MDNRISSQGCILIISLTLHISLLRMDKAKAIIYLFKISICTAFIVHAIFIAYDLIVPKDTVLRFEERSLDDIEFPIIFKICITPAFNITEIQDAGYEIVWDYFTGTSRYSRNRIYGWSGHTENGSIVSNAKGKYCNLW